MPSRLPSVLVATLTVLLAGCTLEPAYHRPPPPVPQLASGPSSGRAAADTGWRDFFIDPQLQQLIALSLADSRDLRVAALNVESAQARYRVQRADLFPTIDATALEEVERFPAGVF